VRAGEEPNSPFRIKADPGLARELAYCVPLGLPHSVFLGWDPDDQDKALAWGAQEQAKCQRCRTDPAEWDPKLGGSRTAYIVEDRRCLGCELLDMASRDLSKQQDTAGIHLGLVPNDEPDDGADEKEVT
jgi:hypothetical protein